jgi:hypothetical protein
MLPACFMLFLSWHILDPQDEGDMFLRSVCYVSAECVAFIAATCQLDALQNMSC